MRKALLILACWAVPNNEAAWWHDRHYDLCMAMADADHNWECETLLTAPGEG